LPHERVDEERRQRQPEGKHVNEDGQQPRRFRWRIVPTAILWVFGAPLAISYTILPIVQLFLPLAVHGQAESLGQWLLGCALMVVAGLIWCTAGVACWKARWRLAIFGTILGYVMGVAAARLAFPHGM
jgi:hypothetical protein